jgi:hypothetical protein
MVPHATKPITINFRTFYIPLCGVRPFDQRIEPIKDVSEVRCPRCRSIIEGYTSKYEAHLDQRPSP